MADLRESRWGYQKNVEGRFQKEEGKADREMDQLFALEVVTRVLRQ